MKIICSTLLILLPLMCRSTYAILPEIIEKAAALPNLNGESQLPIEAENEDQPTQLPTVEENDPPSTENTGENSDLGEEEWDDEEDSPEEEEEARKTQEEINELMKGLEAKWTIDDYESMTVKKSSMPKAGKVLKAIKLTKQFKNAIVIAHNRARMRTKPSASNMRKMTWDASLAKLATGYTRKCIYEHNPSATNKRFDYVGENLFISMGLPYNEKLLDHAVNAWEGEKTVYNYNTMKCQPGKMCGHYTQVVWADTFKVGCGVTFCGNIDVRGRIWKNAILFGCNYGPGGNYRGEKPFIAGKRCSKCNKRDKCKARLCTNNIRDRLFFNPKMAKWTPWSKWGPCSKTCGMGNQRRTRSCNTFVPTDCGGYGSEVKFCMNKPCNNQKKGVFNYEVVLNDGDNFLPNSLKNLFSNKAHFFRSK